MNLDDLILRPMRREELDLVVDWAADEGWNPGLHDADVVWRADPDGFVAAELHGEFAGGGSIVSYGGQYGFMGLFIVRRDLRGQGVGARLWFHRRDVLRSRLDADAAIGMDGVFDMQPWYARGGFAFSHRNLRMQGVARDTDRSPDVVELAQIPFDVVSSFDAHHFGVPRPLFLSRWITLPDALALGAMRNDEIAGYGVIRRCREGCKIGPLFARSPDVAERLFGALGRFAPGEPVWLDIPENNPDAVALAERHGMAEVFGCARMYLGPPPSTPWDNIYGITTFELG